VTNFSDPDLGHQMVDVIYNLSTVSVSAEVRTTFLTLITDQMMQFYPTFLDC
jgi:hypothetical protein